MKRNFLSSSVLKFSVQMYKLFFNFFCEKILPGETSKIIFFETVVRKENFSLTKDRKIEKKY